MTDRLWINSFMWLVTKCTSLYTRTARKRPLPGRLDPAVTTDRPTDLTYLKPRPYGYRRGRGLEGEALPRYRWERLSLSRTPTKTTTDFMNVRSWRKVNAPWTRGRTQRYIMYARRPSAENECYVPRFRRTTLWTAATRWSAHYDQSDRQACAHTYAHTTGVFLTSHTHTHTHTPIPLITHTDTGTSNLFVNTLTLTPLLSVTIYILFSNWINPFSYKFLTTRLFQHLLPHSYQTLAGWRVWQEGGQ